MSSRWPRRSSRIGPTSCSSPPGSRRTRSASGRGESDLVQQALLAAVGSIREGRARLPGPDEAEIRAWLRRILINTHRDRLRYHLAQERSPDREHRDGAVEVEADSSSPFSKAARNEEAKRFDLAKLALDEDDRKILSWRLDDDLTFAEIGARLGCSTSWARRACQQAAARLIAAQKRGPGPTQAAEETT